MRVGHALLQERCGLIQPKFAKHVDLSHCNLVTVDGLKQCCAIQTLILRYNSISIVPAVISSLSELWKLDLSHNLVCSLEGLLKVRCIGTLVLSYNNLTWAELRKIQHITILDLRLAGNPKLEKDQYYRRHVIDCLPNIWMLDGVLVTAAEREQVSRFFKNSEVLDRPVRHKLRPIAVSKFVPSHIKHLNQQAILGKNGLQLLSRFSQNERQTLRTDYRRISYLAEMFETDVALQRSYWSLMARSGHLPPQSSTPLPAYMHPPVTTTNNNSTCDIQEPITGYDEEEEEIAPHGFAQVPPLVKLLKCRGEEVEKCNMLLLLLVAGLEFSLPLSLIEETLHTANLDTIGGVDCSTLLQLPHEDLLLTSSILLGSVIIDRCEGEEGGLYKRLFVAVYVVLCNLLRTTHGYPSQYQLKFMSPVVHRALLAAEVVQLMCLVPSFLDLIDRDQGVLDVVAIATQDPHIRDVLQDMMWNATDYDFEEVSAGILHLVRGCIERSNYDMYELEEGPVPYQSPLSAVAIHTKKKITQRAKSAVAARRKRNQGSVRVVKLGDIVSLSRQRKGRVIGLHQDQLALVQISSHPVTPIREACGEYVYIDMQFMTWDNVAMCWTQQQHIQEYPSDTRMTGKTEKCYSVISNSDYSRYQTSYKTSEDGATSEIGERYYVHENRQLQLEVDNEGAQYIAQRNPQPPHTAPGLSDGVFAQEQHVQVRLTPQREAVPVMKQVLEHATEQVIYKQEQELKHRSGPVSAIDVVHQLYQPAPTTDTSITGDTDPDITVPRSEVRVIPAKHQVSSPTNRARQTRSQQSSVRNEVPPTPHNRSRDNNRSRDRKSPAAVSRSHDSIQFDPRSTKPQESAWSSRSLRRPHTRSSLRSQGPVAQTNTDCDPLLTKQKSLPDVSGISLFAYSMGRVGFIKPPDTTDQLATCRSKDINKNRFGVGVVPKLRTQNT